MGFIRKTFSLSTAGLISFRSPKEQSARYQKQARDIELAKLKIVEAEINRDNPHPPPARTGFWATMVAETQADMERRRLNRWR